MDLVLLRLKQLVLAMVLATGLLVFFNLCLTCVGTVSMTYSPGITVKRSLQNMDYNDDEDDEFEDYVHQKTLSAFENSEKRLPSALVIGVKKGGTRALLEFLRIHPDIRATGPEIHFFDRRYNMGLDWYREKMPSTLPGQLTMEKTPSYFITKQAPQRIYKMSNATKLIVVVRDPVTRAISDYTQASTKRMGIKTFEQLAFLNQDTGLVDTSWGAIKIGVYAKHMERWLQYFPLSQIHIVSGEELISNPAKVMEEVQDFLGLKQIITDKHFYFNKTKGFPCLKKKGGNGSPHCLGKTKGREHPIVDPKAIQRLRDFYRPFNTRFYQLVGRNFGWP